MVLVAPELEVGFTVLYAGVAGIHCRRSGSRRQRRFVAALPFSAHRTVGSLVLLTAADEAAIAFLFLLTPTALLAAVPPPPALGALAIKLLTLLPPFRL